STASGAGSRPGPTPRSRSHARPSTPSCSARETVRRCLRAVRSPFRATVPSWVSSSACSTRAIQCSRSSRPEGPHGPCTQSRADLARIGDVSPELHLRVCAAYVRGRSAEVKHELAQGTPLVDVAERVDGLLEWDARPDYRLDEPFVDHLAHGLADGLVARRVAHHVGAPAGAHD